MRTIIDSLNNTILNSAGDTVVSRLDTLTISGDTTFSINDILRMKDGVDDEWMKVDITSSAPTYLVYRDCGDTYTATTLPAWKKGTAVINFGGNGEGLIFMTASEANNPYIDVVTHSGSPWTTLTTRMRMGNLNGFLGYTSNLYGIAIGETTKYLKYDPTNGLQIRGNITTSSLTACTISASSINTSTLTSVTINASVITAASSYSGVSIPTTYTDAKATDPNADETISNTAAAITGQGNLATKNEADANVLNMTNAPAEAGADVTGAHTALNTLSVSNLAASYVSGWAHASDVTKIDGGDMYVGSTITLGSSGHIKSGQTGYNIGTGWWIGDVSGTPKFSIGNSSTNQTLTWNGSILSVGSLTANSMIKIGTTGYVYIDGANEVIKVYDTASNLRVELGKLT